MPDGFLLSRVLLRFEQTAEDHLGDLSAAALTPDGNLWVGSDELAGTGNLLTEALADDNHLGPFLSFPLPNKENGFDIEGLAVRGDRVFLGLRGPVLRGWAVIIEIAVEELDAGVLTLKSIGPSDALYKKHFVDLNGLGIRELCFLGEDLIILAGPTMALEGAMRVFRLQRILEQLSDSLSSQDSDDLEVLFDLPLTIGSDHAEGLTLFPCLDHNPALMVVYDDPNVARRSDAYSVYADVFRLPLSPPLSGTTAM